MNILLIGSGGREHAILMSLKKSPRIQKVYCFTENFGIQKHAEYVDFRGKSFGDIADWAEKNNIALTVVGPEQPLVDGIVDVFQNRGLRIFGPDSRAARLEGSKAYMKDFLTKCQIPTASYEIFSDKVSVLKSIEQKSYPFVIKTDALALGKGAFVCTKKEESDEALHLIFDKKLFSSSNQKVVVESFLKGEEVSILAFCNGHRALLMPSSRDYKRIFDGNKGPQTGGVGCYSPHPLLNETLLQEIHDRVFVPTLQGLQKEGIFYKGILYAGLMMTKNGIFVLEFNIRFGDPETQVILPRIQNDLVDIFEACLDEKLDKMSLCIDAKKTVGVVLSSYGYPGSYAKGQLVTIDPSLEQREDFHIFHAGTCVDQHGHCRTAGGRVITLVAEGKSLLEGRKKVYENIDAVDFENKQYRTDIALNSGV